VKTGLQIGYEAMNLLLHRPFLVYVLTQLSSPEFTNINSIPSSIASRAQKALNFAVKHVSMVRTLPHIDWFSLKQVLIGTLLVIAASKLMEDDAILQQEVVDTLNGATEIFARAAKSSESAKRALQLISEIRVGMKSNGGS
jgi:hypothetical protein